MYLEIIILHDINTNTWENTSKGAQIRNREGVTSPDMSLGGECPLTRQIRALSRGENGPKPKANVLQIAFAGVAHAVLEA